MLKREIKITGDGSSTLYIPDWDESYHSKHGALQEAMHVFIQNGFEQFQDLSEIHILEYGFGTGLNALLTLLMAERTSTKVIYNSIEKFPIAAHEIKQLSYPQEIANAFELYEDTIRSYFNKIHDAPWNQDVKISENFTLKKIQEDFKSVKLNEAQYDIIYFDAFGKRVQPALWTEEIFENTYQALKCNGLLTTYACNGSTKRALKTIGYEVQKLAGPPGKREMINAWKKPIQ